MNTDIFLRGIRLALRQSDAQAIRLNLERILRKAAESEIAWRLRAEIQLEAVRAYRALGQHPEAVTLCDASIATIPPDCFDLLSALKRLRSLLHLDAGEGEPARLLIDGTDGLEIVLQGGVSLVTRKDEQVTVETWLVSWEIAFAQGDMPAAAECFAKAIARLAVEEAELRRRRIAFFDKRRVEQYYHDVSQMLNLCGLTLALADDQGAARQHLSELYATVRQENEMFPSQQKLPNVPLQSKLECLLGLWSESQATPAGLSLSEARRWTHFGHSAGSVSINHDAPLMLLPVETEVAVNDDVSTVVSLAASDSPAATALQVSSAAALQRMAAVFERISTVLPDFEIYLRGQRAPDFGQRGFGGHLLDTDLFTLLHNAKKLNLTGIIKFAWAATLFELPVVKGVLPDMARCGGASLYLVKGFVIDLEFNGQSQTNTPKLAYDNFLLLTRLCFSINADDTRPDIQAQAIPQPAVEQRPRHLSIRENDLLAITAKLDEMAAGFEQEEAGPALIESTGPASSANILPLA